MSPLAAFRHHGRERHAFTRWLPTLALAALLLCTVALLNGGPIYYPDTGGYLTDADRLFHLHAPYGVRPVFYGLMIATGAEMLPISWATNFSLVLFVQAFIVAHLVMLTLRAVGTALQPAGFLLLTASLVLLTPLSFHVSHLIPDIYIAVMSLALFLLAFCTETLRRWETIYLVVLAAAAASLHLTALPVGAAIIGLSVLLALVGERWSRPALAALPLAMAAAALLAFSVLVFQRLTFEPNGPPHLLARVIADGPGADYLRATCPTSGYMLCSYLDRLPLTEDEIMWRLLPSIPSADGYKIKAEQSQVVRGTLAMFPAQVAWHALSNALRQMVTFQAETQVSPAEWAEFLASGVPWASAFSETRQAKGALEGTALAGINAIQAGVTLISLLVALATLPRLIAARQTRPALLTTTILLVLMVNATLCGVLGGVFARYEGRLIWLLPLAAIVSVICLTRQPRNIPKIAFAAAN